MITFFLVVLFITEKYINALRVRKLYAFYQYEYGTLVVLFKHKILLWYFLVQPSEKSSNFNSAYRIDLLLNCWYNKMNYWCNDETL
jgi:hypothetical protein